LLKGKYGAEAVAAAQMRIFAEHRRTRLPE
jgi:hypothetical protein